MALVQKYAAIAMLLVLVVFNSLFTSNFFSAGTINNIITQCCPTILCSMGMTLVISTGGIDIGVGSVMALAGVMTAKYMPSIGASNKPIAFGDFSFYTIVVREGISLKTLTETMPNFNDVGYLSYEFLDGKLVRPEAIKVMQMTDTAA